MDKFFEVLSWAGIVNIYALLIALILVMFDFNAMIFIYPLISMGVIMTIMIICAIIEEVKG